MRRFLIHNNTRQINWNRFLNPGSPALACLIVAVCYFLPVAAFSAQLTPGSVERQFEKRPTPRSTDSPSLPTPLAPQSPQVVDGYRFVLKSIIFEGGTVYSETELRPYYHNFVDQEISVATLFTIADEITARYADDGYALSLAYVPAQEIDKTGAVRLVIVEGYIGEVQYRGDVDSLSRRAKRQIETVLTDRPLKAATLERQLLLANDLPGISFVSTIDRSEIEVGAACLVVEIINKPFGFSMGMNNRGSRAQGPWRTSLGGHVNHLIVADSTIGFQTQRTFHAAEMQYYAFDYSQVVSDSGLRLNLLANLSRSEPDVDVLRDLDYKTLSENYNVGISYPFIRSRQQNFDGSLRLDIKESDSEFFGLTYSDEKTRIIRLGATYDWVDRFGATSLVHISLNQGLDIFGATDNDSSMKVREAADYTFTSVRLDGSRSQPLGHTFSLFFTTTMQYASDPLASTEQLGWGGELSGRAYDSFELSGDHGIMAGVELRQTWSFPLTRINYLQPYVFFEAAKLWTELDTASGGGTDHTSEYDYGLGIRGRVAGKHYFYVEMNQPGDRDVAQERDRDGRVFVGWQMIY